MKIVLIVMVVLGVGQMLYGMIKNLLEDRKRRFEDKKIITLFNECLVNNLFPVTVDYDVQWAGESERAPTTFYAERTYEYPKARGFPPALTGVRETNLELVSFKRELAPDEVLREIETMGYRPAEFLEYKSFSAKFSHPPFPFPIIFSGVVAVEKFNYPPVTRSSAGAIAIGCDGRCCRQPSNRWTAEKIFTSGKWAAQCHFAVVKLSDD